MRIPLHRAFHSRRHRRDSGRARKKFLVPMFTLALLASVFQPLVAPQTASAAVDDFRPATYNMQGSSGGSATKWSTDIPQILRGGYNMVALQEAGPQPPGWLAWTSQYLEADQNWRGWRVQHYRWRPPGQAADWSIYFLRTDFGANRVNLAILTQQQASHVMVIRPAGWRNGLPTTRPALGITVNGTDFYSVHASASGGGDGAQLLSNIADTSRGSIWAAMGDWNRPPNTLQTQPGWHRYISNRATHQNSRELDYMVSNQRMAGYGGVPRAYGSDHYAVMFRRLAANAGVMLLNSHDGGKHLGVQNSVWGTAVVNGGTPNSGLWKFKAAAPGLYNIVNATTGTCWSDNNGRIIQWGCNGAADQLFKVSYWWDVPDQIRIRPVNRSTQCVGDDNRWGWGTEVFTTVNCNKGEARFNVRYDRDPGPNAPLVVF